MEWVDLIQTFGLPVALTVFFVWQSSVREERQNKHIFAMEEFTQIQLVELIEKTNKVLERNLIIMEHLESYLERDRTESR